MLENLYQLGGMIVVPSAASGSDQLETANFSPHLPLILLFIFKEKYPKLFP